MFTSDGSGKQTNISIKRLALIGSRLLLLSIIFVFSFAIPVSAEPEAVFTGCLNQHSGELHKVAIGLEPLGTCNPAEVQVTWSSGVPGVEGRITALETRIAELENDLAPLDVTVNCPDESIGSALQQAGNRPAHVTITIYGTCKEQVVIARDNTTLHGASPGDGIQAPSPGGIVLALKARNIALDQLTLTGGGEGIRGSNAASFSAEAVHISGSTNGVYVEQNAAGDLYNSTIENTYIGVLASTGGAVRMFGGRIDANTAHGAEASFGGYIGLYDGTVLRNSQFIAVHAREGGIIDISNATVENNDFGVFAIGGGHVTISNGSIIQHNTRGGVAADGSSSIWLKGGSHVSNNDGSGVGAGSSSSLVLQDVIIEHNGNDGISVGGGATARFDGGTIIQNNIGHGISLGEMSAAIFHDNTVQIVGNTGIAIRCSPGAVAQIFGAPGTINGNGSDLIECPLSFP